MFGGGGGSSPSSAKSHLARSSWDLEASAPRASTPAMGRRSTWRSPCISASGSPYRLGCAAPDVKRSAAVAGTSGCRDPLWSGCARSGSALRRARPADFERVRFLSVSRLAQSAGGDLLCRWHERSTSVRYIPAIGAGSYTGCYVGLRVAGGAGGEGDGRARQPSSAQVRHDARSFYEIMARAALEAIGLRTLLEEFARAEQELRNADEGSTVVVYADATTPPEDLSDFPQDELSEPPVTRMGCESGVVAAPNRGERKLGGPRTLACGASGRLSPCSEQPPAEPRSRSLYRRQGVSTSPVS